LKLLIVLLYLYYHPVVSVSFCRFDVIVVVIAFFLFFTLFISLLH
jgi:hypothetical protein